MPFFFTCTCPIDCSRVINSNKKYFKLDGHMGEKNQQWLTRWQLRQAVSLLGLTAVSVSSYAGKGCTKTNAFGKTLGIPLLMRKESHRWISFYTFFCCCTHGTMSRCIVLHTSIELILIPNCSLLYLHSNDMKSFKSA